MHNKPFTSREAAEYLSLTPRTIRSYIRRKLLKANFIGGQYLILPEAIREFIEQGGK
ncbi:MAG TPA: helix-turn-helix domain-containing protein [Edaphobacter sp.]|nr:helix-turn-helix domain-containing protein [Edaphobacter sp.]